MSIASGPKQCPKCGGAIPADAAQGLCPKCLLQQASVPTEAGTAGASAAQPPSTLELAAAFPQLEILGLIGQGGMGFVFKARQVKLDRFVALKILPQSLAADPAFAERFTREGRLLARLNHPNIVTVHDFGLCNGWFYLLMEFIDGVNLREAMKAGRFTSAQALAIVPKICEALQFAHNEGVLHRDIKPENILLDARGRVKIADFGIAKLIGETRDDDISLTKTGSSMGTPSYMAPEQIEKSASVDHRADIYSLGVVFYEMLTGGLPIGHFALPSEKSYTDPRLDDVVLRALEKDPARRTQSAAEVKTQVETISGGGAPAAIRRETPAGAKTDQFWRWFAVVALVLIVVPAGIALLNGPVSQYLKARREARARLFQFWSRTAADASPFYGFESNASGTYSLGSTFDGWVVTNNEIGLVTDSRGAHGGSNYLALADGRISKTFTAIIGQTYQLQFYARGGGLVHWWPGDGNATDVIGGGAGSMRDVSFAGGQVGQAFHFENRPVAPQPGSIRPTAETSEMDFGPEAGNFGTNDFTIAFWIKQPPTCQGLYTVLSKRPECDAVLSTWDIRTGKVDNWNKGAPGTIDVEVSGDHNSGLWHYCSTKSINDGSFHHVAITRHGTVLRTFIDGLMDSAGNAGDYGVADIGNTTSMLAGTSPCVGVDGTKPFPGYLDGIQLYEKALPAEDINRLYQENRQEKRGRLNELKALGLTHWWPATANGNDVAGAANAVLHNIDSKYTQPGQAFHFNGKISPPPYVSFPVFNSGGEYARNVEPSGSEIDFGPNVCNFRTNDFTIDFWIKQAPDQTGLYGVLEKRPQCYPSRSYFDIHVGKEAALAMSFPGSLFFDSAGNGTASFSLAIATKPINDGVFHHAAFVRQGRTNSIYIDGELNVSDIAPGIADIYNSEPFRAGQSACIGTDGSLPFQGELDELRVFQRALSPAEIRASYRAGSSGTYSAQGSLPTLQVAVRDVMTNSSVLTNSTGSWQLVTEKFTAKDPELAIDLSGNAPGVLVDDIEIAPVAAK